MIQKEKMKQPRGWRGRANRIPKYVAPKVQIARAVAGAAEQTGRRESRKNISITYP